MAAFFSIMIISGGAPKAQSLATIDQDLSTIVDRARPAVVSVEARSGEMPQPMFPGTNQSQSHAVNTVIGSGVLIDSLGHILTTMSLVDNRVSFRININNRLQRARLVGIDRRLGLAVLKIDGLYQQYPEVSEIPPLVGHLAVALGRSIGGICYPSLGIIAGRRPDGAYLLSGSILPGVVGGAVFDLSGNLTGIIISGSVNEPSRTDNLWNGIVFIPAQMAVTAAEGIICYGDSEAGWLGISTAAIELVSDKGEVLGDAVIIAEIEHDSPADRSGLRPGDIITRFGEYEISGETDLQRLVAGAGPDSVIVLEFLRNNRSYSRPIRLQPRPVGQGPMVNASATFEVSVKNGNGSGAVRREIDSLQEELNRIEKRLNLLLRKSQASP